MLPSEITMYSCMNIAIKLSKMGECVYWIRSLCFYLQFLPFDLYMVQFAPSYPSWECSHGQMCGLRKMIQKHYYLAILEPVSIQRSIIVWWNHWPNWKYALVDDNSNQEEDSVLDFNLVGRRQYSAGGDHVWVGSHRYF